MDTNEIRSNYLITQIEKNKNLDLRDRAREIEEQLNTDRTQTLHWFGILIDLNHAKLHGLGDTHHADREGGWGFSERDDKFLSSLREQHLGHVYGIRVNWRTINALTTKQVQALARCISRPFYTLQLALIKPTAS